MTGRKVCVCLTNEKKLKVIQALQQPGETFTSVSQKFKVDRRTVARLQKSKAEILQNAITQRKRKTQRKGSLLDFFYCLYFSFTSVPIFLLDGRSSTRVDKSPANLRRPTFW